MAINILNFPIRSQLITASYQNKSTTCGNQCWTVKGPISIDTDVNCIKTGNAEVTVDTIPQPFALKNTG